MPIIPDTKDWTWVLERRCPECGFEAQSFAREHVGQMIRDNAVAWQSVLARDRGVTTRPSDDRWSALEYGCHVRDVLRLYDERLTLVLGQDGPEFPDWDQDATAVEERYHEQDPAVVADEVSAAAARLADHFDAVTDDAWQRTGTRSDGARFTVESFARYLVHDPVHHLDDVARGFVVLDRSGGA